MKHLNHGLVDNCEITTACEIHIKIKVNIDVYVIKRVCVQQKFGENLKARRNLY